MACLAVYDIPCCVIHRYHDRRCKVFRMGPGCAKGISVTCTGGYRCRCRIGNLYMVRLSTNKGVAWRTIIDFRAASICQVDAMVLGVAYSHTYTLWRIGMTAGAPNICRCPGVVVVKRVHRVDCGNAGDIMLEWIALSRMASGTVALCINVIRYINMTAAAFLV